MNKITQIKAREILDSRGNPTVEAEVRTKHSIGRAIVPSGASTGIHEAIELRDKGSRYLGKGVSKAIKNIEKKIRPKLLGIEVTKQTKIDEIMLKLDGTKNKKKLGANAILAVSLATARCAANSNKEELYEYLARLHGNTKLTIPVPYMNIINGGRHATNGLAFQEFMIVPQEKEIGKNLQLAAETYQTLKSLIKRKYGGQSTSVGDEGGFAPNIRTANEALQLLKDTVKILGYEKKIKFATDVAASEFYKKEKYYADKKIFTKEEFAQHLKELIKKYNIVSVEDPLQEEDFLGFKKLLKETKTRIVGDDLLCTNPRRIKRAIITGSCNVLLLKVNQIGTLSEAMEAAKLAQQAGWNIMVSHRSGETEDTFIADLAVGIGAKMIKAGAPCRGERTAKYNRLIRISEQIQ